MDKNKKEIILTIIKLAIVIIIATICVRFLTGGETLSEYRQKQATTLVTTEENR